MYQSWYYDLNIRICIFNQPDCLFYFLFCRFIVRDVISSGMNNYGVGVLTEYRLDVISYVLCWAPWLWSYVTLWSFEIPLSAKPFIIESPMIKTFFLSLVTFVCFYGVFIPFGSLFSLTTSTSGFCKLLSDSCKINFNLGIVI